MLHERHRRWWVNEDGFEFTHCPIEDTLTITETETGYVAKYLTRDGNPWSPAEGGGDNEDLFLVHYHRQCYIKNPLCSERDLRNWYRQDFSDYEDEQTGEPLTGIPQEAFSHIPYVHKRKK